MTLIWSVVWLISNLIGDKESLTLDPVNCRSSSTAVEEITVGSQSAAPIAVRNRPTPARTVNDRDH